MDYSYSYNTFFSIVLALVCLCALVVKTFFSLSHNPRLYTLWCLSGVCVISAWSLAIVCPFKNVLSFLRLAEVLFLLPFLYASIVLFLTSRFVLKGKKVDLYEKLIIDNIREHSIIFNKQGRIVSFGHTNLFPDIFILNEIPHITEGHILEDLRGISTQCNEKTGTIHLGDKSWYFRFKNLPRNRGSLLTFLDISQEQRLLDDLKCMSRSLSRRERLLSSLEGEGADEQLARIQEHITTQIEAEVRKQIERLMNVLAADSPYDELIRAAEEGLAEVRRMVAELSPWKEAG